jgi:TonB-dependent receptor
MDSIRVAVLRSSLLLSASCAAMMMVAVPNEALAQGVPQQAWDEAIVVTGQRLSTTASIESKRTADGVVDVISADDLGKLPDANVADALARIPGISVVVNQDTGEGEYVAVRGLSGTYNAVSVNGVRVAQTDPSSRDVSLTVLPPNGLAEVRVTKTLTPDQDGDAIGGSINFRTPTAFDFQDRTIVRLYASAGLNEQAEDAGEDSGSYQLQGDLGWRAADDRFGIFASVNYGVSHGNGQETENDGEWEPYIWRRDAEERIDESNMHLPGIDLDYRRLKQTRYGGNVSLDYRGDSTQLYLRGQYSRQEQRGSNDLTFYLNRPTARLTQVDPENNSLVRPEDAIIGVDATKGAIYGYDTTQIVDADGDGLITDADAGAPGYWSLNGRSGVWNPQAFEFGREFATINLDQTLYTANAGGATKLGALKLEYDVSYSSGERGTPDGYEIAFGCDKCTWPLDATGIDWVSSDPRFPKAGLPAFARFVETDSSLLQFDGAEHYRDSQSDDRIALRLDARYDVGSVLDHVKVGGKYLRSEREYDNTVLYDGDFSGTLLDGLNLEQSGLVQKEVTSILNGEYYYGDVYSQDAVIAAIRDAERANPLDPADTGQLADDKSSTETVYAAYALANFQFDALRLITGARVERRETHNEFWSEDGDNSGFDTTDRSYTVFLPSATGQWRLSPRHIVRAAVWTGYSPPEFGYISAGQTITREPGTGEIIGISRGNPDLKPARALNFDLSMEYYPDSSSIIAATAYYKRIDNFIFTNSSEVAGTVLNGPIEITQPQNGQLATLYGFELNFIKSLQELAAPFDGFGLEANLTVQKSEAETGQAYRRGRPIRLINAPHLLYNAAITYQKYGVQAKLSYNYRGKFIEDLRDNGVDKWVRPNKGLDFHSRYNLTENFALEFDVANILGGWKYYTTKGDSPSYMKDYMEPGRTYTLRASYVF